MSYDKLPWPKSVYILEAKDIGPELSDRYDKPQTIWGHLNNIFKQDCLTALCDVHLMMDVYMGRFAIACHILKVAQYSRKNKDAPLNILAFNAAWASLGYVNGQDDAVLSLGTKVNSKATQHGKKEVSKPKPVKSFTRSSPKRKADHRTKGVRGSKHKRR